MIGIFAVKVLYSVILLCLKYSALDIKCNKSMKNAIVQFNSFFRGVTFISLFVSFLMANQITDSLESHSTCFTFKRFLTGMSCLMIN